jgi:hypothetical protein
MFLAELSPDQKRALLVLARQVIAADDRLALPELERLEALYSEAGLPAETAAAPDAVGDLNYMFDTPRARAVALLELLLMAHADGRADAREEAAVRSLAERMDVGEADWQALRGWSLRHAALVAEARAFGES